MTATARTAIFASIREHLAASSRFDEGHHEPILESDVSVRAVYEDAIERLGNSFDLVGAHFTAVGSEDEAARRLREIIRDKSARKIVISDSDLVRRLTEGVETIEDASREELFASDIGITSAQWAIAETGTLVLESSAERHRLVSLVPPVHACVVRASTIRHSMSEILALLDTNANPAVTFVTGASRTSDIELTLAIGVHGPRELYVIVIKDQ